MKRVSKTDKQESGQGPLRRGWTTGACATAATKSALHALFCGDFIDPVEIALPKGDTPSFVLARQELGYGIATASIIKDAGDDPDVTHGATITVSVRKTGKGITFKAGNGVGTVTKSGLPIAVGEPAINPVPRQLMQQVVEEICSEHDQLPNVEITISVPGGVEMAKHTWNPRLGIIGGISILGTTGVVHPFSCSAWIHSIHRGIDVCRANDINHALAATGSTSETAAQKLYNFPDAALLDMGDFAGGVLKYLRSNPIPKITIAGGFAKLSKLANGSMDLHSGRSQIDMNWLSDQALKAGMDQAHIPAIQNANTAMQALELTQHFGINLPIWIAKLAKLEALKVLREAPVEIEVLVISRNGKLLAQTGF